jgi:hypothetical protein
VHGTPIFPKLSDFDGAVAVEGWCCRDPITGMAVKTDFIREEELVT